MPKKKIINIKKEIVNSALIASLIISSLTGCELKEIPTAVIPEVSASFEEYESTLGKRTKDYKETTYKAEDVLIVKAFDPCAGKDIYRFMTLCTHNYEKDEEKNEKNCLKIFQDTLLVNYIRSKSATIENNYYLYTSIFDQSLYAINIYYVDSSSLSGTDIESNFKTEYNIVFSSSNTSTYNIEEGYNLISKYSWAKDIENNLYVDYDNPESYNTFTYTYADFFGIDPQNIITESELKTDYEELNNSLTR